MTIKVNSSFNKTLLIMLLFVFGILPLVLITLFSSLLTTKATSSDPDLEVTVREMLALSLVNCDASSNAIVKLDIEPTPTGVFKSNCQTVSIETNAPGYTLKVKSSTSDLTYQNPTTITTLPTIPSTLNSIGGTPAPSTLNTDTWGFAVEGDTTLGFDPSYTINNSNNKFALLPTTDQTVYQIDEHPTTIVPHTLYYGANVTSETMAGTYATTITYTGIAATVPPAPKNCKNMEGECILFTVDPTTDAATNTTYSIPTSGYVTGNSNHTYDWDVYVDGYLINTTQCPDGNCTGTSSTTLPNAAGIEISGLTPNPHQILIVPHNDAEPGWGNAFGYYGSVNTGTANITVNKRKLISLDAPLTTKAFAPKTTESTTSASYMFANLFVGCANLTTTMQILNTYTLPSTITNLSSFLYSTHNNNSQLTKSIDLSPIASWFNSNTLITNLSNFLYQTHSGNSSLTSPINLSPVSGWFNINTTINNLSNFLYQTHNANSSLTSPIDLAPLKNWFKDNERITNLSGFLQATHSSNTSLTSPIDLTPIKNWFNSNDSIINLSNFLYSTHNNNNPSLTSLIDLTPVKDWFKDNERITNLSNFLYSTHTGVTSPTSPIDLTPLRDWFNGNDSITNLSNFLYMTHSSSSFTNPINLMPLSNWFEANRSVTTLNGFMTATHNNNLNLVLTGQVILPNWIKTMTDGSGTPLYNTGTTLSNYSFYQAFYLLNTRPYDTGEVEFEDSSGGITVLSDLGTPSANRYTYTNRTFFQTSLGGTNWY